MIVHELAAELLVDARAEIGECPVWDAASASLLWLDIGASTIWRTDATGATSRVGVTPSTVGCIALRRSTGVVLALPDGFWAMDTASGRLDQLAQVELQGGARFNDGACDPAGRLLAGTIGPGRDPGGGDLYSPDADRRVTKRLSGVTLSNGLGWSPDGRTLYYVDTPTRCLDAFDYDVETGELSRRRTFAEIAEGDGVPDGLAVDAAGGVWVALWGGGSVRRYAADGTLAEVVRVDVSNASSCAFGGPDLATLYITTAWEGMTEDERSDEPTAGGLYVARPGVRGLAAGMFAG